jgi:hypothetical protein
MKEYSYKSTLPKCICGLRKCETLPTLVIASKETGLAVNADKTKYKNMCGDQNAGRSDNIKFHNSSFERVELFRYLGTNLMNQNYIQEGNKCRLKSHNACYRSVQNVLSSTLLSQKIKFKLYSTTGFPLFCMGVKRGRNKTTVNAL